MTATVPQFEELLAPLDWRTVDFISDLHLQASEPATVQAWRHYLHTTQASAIFILGDLFEVWVGDDALFEPGSFEAEACAALRAAAQRLPVYFMQGNRDFLTGHQFLEHCGVTGLSDPTLLIFGAQRFVLTHGDLLCLDDVDYQRFRLLARSEPWQSQFLSQPLATRRAQARGIRQESEARKQTSLQAGSPTGTWYADLDDQAVLAWLQAAGAHTMIHGHTHRPATHDVADGMQRIVLSDWDAAAHPPRAEVLRLTRTGIERQPLAPLQRC